MKPISCGLFPISLCILIPLCLVPIRAYADTTEDIFGRAVFYTVQIKAAVPVPFEGEEQGAWSGAGFMVDRERGWIMTNAHVASRSPSTIEIGFKDRDFVDAYKVYVDPYLDLAIIAMDPSFVPPASVMPELDCGDLPRVGHPVGSFGHPWGLSFTGTRGIISGITSRFLQEDLQTDAPINQGNSGGPLISLQHGKIVGINSATLEEKNAQNVNFALPMKYACKVLELLRAGKNPSPPELPVQFIKDVDERRELRVVNSFLDPEKLSLKSGDLILSIEGSDEKLENETRLIHALRGRLEDFTLVVKRGPDALRLKGSLNHKTNIVDRKGVYFSGILFGHFYYRDKKVMPIGEIMVHSVQKGSIGNFSDIEKGDILDGINGHVVQSLADLYGLVGGFKDHEKITVRLKRFADPPVDSIFEYIEQTIKVEDLRWVSQEKRS
ncbi:MAG: trypsin-like peptidase domain-containing protein [Deltaproteobacteria bacterium]|nr:trypsin-like peptidase domain-containing protein [Candidatus Deferrimicrobium borealis]